MPDREREEEEVEQARQEMHDLEEGDPPEKLEDWPDGRAKYLTYGGPEGTSGYDEGPARKIAAIKAYRDETGASLAEAKRAVEEYTEGRR